ncbi:MAG TPA: hypothetical protein PLP29_17210 [Candidatus Ozemobacteraceae bacterium]|nr:hypothetical protein [Candidatus Ozemobacteraceae bacterium]
MTRHGLILALCFVFFVSAFSCPAPGASPAAWPAPFNLGSGSSPVFRAAPGGVLTLTFERDEQLFRSRLEANGSWSAPVMIATTTVTGGFTASDASGASFLARTREDGSIIVSPNPGNGSQPSPETVIEGTRGVQTDILHFSIDGSGTKHLLYARTKAYDTGSDYPGSDVFYRTQAGGLWGTETPIASGMSISRTFQVPGISVTSRGHLHLCSYGDIYHVPGEGNVTRERCPIQDFSMPSRVAAEENDTLHFVYHSFAEGAPYDQDCLKYVSKGPGGWGRPEIIGAQYAERVPDLFLTPAGELFITWEDPDGNLLVTHRLP